MFPSVMRNASLWLLGEPAGCSAVITAAGSTSPQERPDGLCQFVRVVVVGGVRAGRARDLDTQAVGQSAGGLGLDGVALLAHKHHDGHRDRGQRLVIGQEALVAPELDPEKGLGTGLHARP